MELRQLKYFIKAKELENFSEAAEQLYITQSTLSQQIKQLENELKTPLFHRIGKRVHPTEAGMLFYDYALQCVQKANEGYQMVQDLGNFRGGTLKIGCSYGLKQVLTHTVLLFACQYPDINIQIAFGTSNEVIEKLSGFELDFVLTFDEASDLAQMIYQPLFTSDLCLLTAQSSTISTATSVSMKDILGLPLALPSVGYGTRRYIDQLFMQEGMTPDIKMEINDIPTLLELVNTGHWHTILTQTTASGHSSLIAIPLENRNTRQQATIISLRHAYEKNAARAFKELLLQNYTASQPQEQ